jgi:hypothetical protein
LLTLLTYQEMTGRILSATNERKILGSKKNNIQHSSSHINIIFIDGSEENSIIYIYRLEDEED